MIGDQARIGQRDAIVAALLRQMQQRGPIDTPALDEIQRQATLAAGDIPPHSPASAFATDAVMQGGAPTPTGRDAFDNTQAQDGGGVFSPDPTMGSPAMTSSPHATPTFDVDPNGMPNAPTFDFNAPGYSPAAPGEGGSLTDPGSGGIGGL